MIGFLGGDNTRLLSKVRCKATVSVQWEGEALSDQTGRLIGKEGL